jgi:hypothetical protein
MLSRDCAWVCRRVNDSTFQLGDHTIRALLAGEEVGIEAGPPQPRLRNDRHYGGHFVLKELLWWATLDSNQ